MLSRILPSLIAAAVVANAVNAQQCEDYKTLPPQLPSPSLFTQNYEAGLQIYATSLVIQCEGSLVGWKFVPQNKQVNGLHLAVFRPDFNSLVNGIPTQFEVVGETYIDNFEAPAAGQWATFQPEDSILVKPGDSLGMYYDEYRTQSEDLAVGVASAFGSPEQRQYVNLFDPAVALVFVRDGNQVTKGTVLNGFDAILDRRVGGIGAVVHQDRFNSTSCVVPLVDDDVSCAEQKPRYTFYTNVRDNTKKCEMFNGCERIDGEASNNYPTEDACESNCAKHIPDQAAFLQKHAELIRKAGYALPGFNPSCAIPLRASDWDCESKQTRYHYNIYLDFCVDFKGCVPPVQPGAYNNNWSSGIECNTTCIGFKASVMG